MRKFIKNLLEFIIKLITVKKKEDVKNIPKDNLVDIIEEKIEDLLFEIGIPNLFNSPNVIKLRKIINYEFGLDFKKTPLQCTEYAQYKIQQTGIKIQWPVKSGRDGGKWPDIFEKYGLYKVLDTPKIGCVVSFKEKHGSCGHVAFVEEVLDNERIKISEANYPPMWKIKLKKEPEGEYGIRVLPKSRWQDRYKGRFIDFS